jgi:single-strand DNA-binding protein
MSNLNKVMLMGRLTRDPQQRFLPSGQAVVELGIAINRVFTTNGEKREETTFVDLEAWGQQGDVIHRYLKKGSPIFVEGRLKLDTWQTKEGEKRSRMRVVVERFQFIGGAGQGGAGGAGAPRTAAAGTAGAVGEEAFDPSDFGLDPSNGGGMSASADDVPF